MKVLFVCSSNVCRSPYCEFVFKRECRIRGFCEGSITVSSAAVLNRSKRLHKMAYASLLSEGFTECEIKSFKPNYKKEAENLFEEADVIIGMTKIHGYLTPKRFRNKFLTLSEAADGVYKPVPDPFLKKSQQDYDADMEIIKGYLLRYADNILNEQNPINEERNGIKNS